MTDEGDAAEALRAYDEGAPSTLPESNRFKQAVEAHRWGRHTKPSDPGSCPVCARGSVQAAAEAEAARRVGDFTGDRYAHLGDWDVALVAYDEGVPSLLPDSNRYKRMVEQHRWGVHLKLRWKACPPCARQHQAAQHDSGQGGQGLSAGAR